MNMANRPEGDPDGDARRPPVIVETIFDPACPWCYIGKRRLERALAQRRTAVEVEIRWWPFLLNPNLPHEGVDRAAYLLHRFGSERRISRIYSVLAELGQTVDIDFAFERIRRTPNTVDAHRLVLFANRTGRAGKVVESLFHRHFADGRDIGRRSELVDIAVNAGLDGDAVDAFLQTSDSIAQVFEANARAHRLNINGVPSFVFNGRLIICGAQEPDILVRMLDVACECAGVPGDAVASRPFSLPMSDFRGYSATPGEDHRSGG